MLQSLQRLVAITPVLLIFGLTLQDTSKAQNSLQPRPVPGSNVNMVSGVDWPGGDPFLQRQNEPSMAVSSRNPLHLLAGANDYRSVDLPGIPDKVTADGWVGLFKSFDGGQTWRSTLLPGFPQDNSPEGMASPLKGFTSAADPVMRSGANGLFYYSGIVFERGPGARSRLFVTRFVDDNIEVPDPIRYLDTRIIDAGNPGQFIDKPWLAVDVPRQDGGNITIGNATFPAGNVYVSYSVVQGSPPNEHTKIMFTRSVNGGATWSAPIKLSESTARGQGTVMAVDPSTGAVYVVWRLLEKTASRQADTIMVAKSTDRGKTFVKAVAAVGILPFDQGTTGVSFRTTGYPAIAIDGTGRLYLAWSQFGPGGGTKVMVSTSKDGRSWTAPMAADSETQGHQLMPALTYAAGKIVVLYYDLRDDYTTGLFTPFQGTGGRYLEERIAVSDRAGDPLAVPPVLPNLQNVFNDYVADAYPPQYTVPSEWRHTLDVRVCFALPADSPQFTPSARVSEYRIGSIPGSDTIEQLDYNPPNLPMFSRGTVPFMGDYIDITAQTIVPSALGGWRFNTAPSDSAVYHAVWTDNRNVQPPLDFDWTHYTPVNSFYNNGVSKFDPAQIVPSCSSGQAGTRNQDIFTSRITQGMYVGSPGNSKTLSADLKRSFVVFVENSLEEVRTYKLTILPPPPGVGFASFVESEIINQITLQIAPQSSITRTVFVSSSEARARIQVEVTDQANGRTETLVLNPDPTNPDNTSIETREVFNPKIANPKIANPKIANPKIANPDIASQEVSNPKIANPKIANTQLASPKIANPKIANPKIANPQIANPKIANPKIANPQIENPKIANGSMTDLTWILTNEGNTSAAYTVKMLLNSPNIPSSFDFQLIINKLYATPQANGCDLGVQKTQILIANIIEPRFITDPAQLVDPVADATNPDLSNATLWLGPGEEAQVTLRVIGPSKSAVLNFLSTGVAAAAVAQAANTDDTEYKFAVSSLDIATQPELPTAVVGSFYTTQLAATGATEGPSWSLNLPSTLPGSINLSTDGVLSGTPQPQDSGDYSFSVTVHSGSQTATRTLHMVVSPQLPSTPQLSFEVQPVTTQADTPISPPSGVKVKAADGSGVGLQGIEVSVALASNPGGGILSGTATVATDAVGIAAFPYLKIDEGGTGYTLLASASGAASATSASFDISKSLLAFIVQPSGTPAGLPISPAVQVYAADSNGSPLAGIDVKLTVGSKGGGGALTGATAVTDDYGIATFPGLSVSEGGSGYTIIATAAGISAASSPFDIYDIAFERYPDGAPACSNCAVTTEFAARGVVFAATASPTLLDFAAQYGPAGMPSNHGIMPGAAGTLSMRFPGTPRGVSFEQRFMSQVTDPKSLLTAYDANDNPIPNSRITWTNSPDYVTGFGIDMAWVTISITSMTGISRVDFAASDNYFPIVDNVLIFLYGETTDPIGDVGAGDPDLASASIAVRNGYLELRVRLWSGTFDPVASGIVLFLDTDRNINTGFPGLRTDSLTDTTMIGSEFIVSAPTTCGQTGALVFQHLGDQYSDGLPNLSGLGIDTVPVSYHGDLNGFDVVIPLSLLGNIDGRLNYKVTSSKQLPIPGCLYSGLLDAVPNVGTAPATVR